MNNTYFVISSFGKTDYGWLEKYSIKNFHIYLKDNNFPENVSVSNITKMENVGYNISSYMKYIIDNYDNLPDIIVFCKNNVFPRHVSEERFIELCSRKVFTSIEEPSNWDLYFPLSALSCDNGFLEINNSWYTPYHPKKYFNEFNDFWKFIFKTEQVPKFIRFAPGANYVVPRENIRLRSKEFYINILNFVSHHQLSGESHMVERALYAIWNSTLIESDRMGTVLDKNHLNIIAKSKSAEMSKIKRFKNHWFVKSITIINKILGSD